MVLLEGQGILERLINNQNAGSTLSRPEQER